MTSLRILATLAIAIAPTLASAAILPITNGLVLNFQADNINGLGNAGMLDGQEVTTWVDTIQLGGNATANDLTVPGASSYLVNQGTPNFVAGPIPGVRFTRTGANAGDALGFDGSVNGLLTNNAFTAFFVGAIDNLNGGPARIAQFGFRNAGNNRIVALANTGMRFNGGSKVYNDPNENQFNTPPHYATYTMDMTQAYASSTVHYRVDGVDGTGPTTSVAPNAGPLNLTSFNQGIVMGGGKNNTATFIDPLNGIVNALIIYNRQLSTTEIEQVEEFLYENYIIPEPSSLALLGVGAAVALWRGRRWRSPRR